MKLGDRISVDGEYGSVRYIGEVAKTKGEWIGVEWDNTDRGKHDGMFNGVRYFETSSAKSASFIRPSKAHHGVDFLTAVQQRYGAVDDGKGGVVEEDLFVMGKGKTTVVEMVGAEKINLQQSQYTHLREIVLRGMDIHGVTPDAHLNQMFPQVKELDLSKNLLSSLESVARICQHLTNLQVLNVSDNRLDLPVNDGAFASKFQNVNTLFMNRENFTWTQLLTCVSHFPMLQALHACFNKITALSDVKQSLRHLQLLNLEGNKLDGWQEVLHLSNLTQLETLILNETGVGEVFFNDVEHGKTSACFTSLKSLSLNRNNLSEWSSINELNKLASLRELKCVKNPLTSESDKMAYETVRTLIVARIGSLTLLDRSTITRQERLGCEYDYIKSEGRRWKAAGGDPDPAKSKVNSEFKNQHPRYLHLVERYGPPLEEEMKEHSSALKNSLIAVFISCDRVKKAPQPKKLLYTMTVQKLRALVTRMYGADPLTTQLSYVSARVGGPQVDFDNDMREIGFYGLENGDTITVTWE